MGTRSVLYILLLASVQVGEAAATRNCAGGLSVADFQLLVKPSGDGTPKPLGKIHAIPQGYTLIYQPGQLPAHVDKDAQVAMVIAPVNNGSAKKPELVVTEPKSALKRAEWQTPVAVDVAALVYGPQGLDRGKVKSLIRNDEELVSQLADYAEQTALAEAVINSLSSDAQRGFSTGGLEAAVNGLSARYGQSFTRLDRTAPLDQQAAALLRGLNPALSAYDPLSPTPASRLAQSTGLAASVAGLFFDNTMGLVAGGAVLATNLRTLMFPDTEFRSAFTQTGETSNNMTLCAKREPRKSRIRMAYLWAQRIPNTTAPSLTIASASYIPAGVAATIPVELGKGATWPSVETAEDWTLVAKSDGARIPVKLKALPAAKSLQIDTGQGKPPKGEYLLTAKWDWTAFEIGGTLHTEPPAKLSEAKVQSASQDRLIQGAGIVPVILAGPDFEFVSKVSLKPASAGPSASNSGKELPVSAHQSQLPGAALQPLAEGDFRADLPFSLPKGRGAGPQDQMTINIDTTGLKAAHYALVLSQSDGSGYEVPLRILPPNPTLSSLPLRANLGEQEQKIELTGAGLGRVEAISSEEATFSLLPPACAKQDPSHRTAVIRLNPGISVGRKLALHLKVEGLQEPVLVPDAVAVAGPRPRVMAAQLSRPENLSVMLEPGELPADSFVTVSMRVEPLEGQPSVHIRCAEQERTLSPQSLRPGERTSAASLEYAGAGMLFLSVSPGAIGQSGCRLVATVDTAGEGSSDPYVIGRVVRLPRIERFSLTDEKAGDSAYVGILEGEHLEAISLAGWDPDHGLPVSGLPTPVAGDGRKQTLRISMVWPSPSPRAPLYIWLQEEKKGRRTEIRY